MNKVSSRQVVSTTESANSLLPTKEVKGPSRVLSTFNVFNYKPVYVLDKICRRISDNLVSVAGIISPAEFFVFEQNFEKIGNTKETKNLT